MFLAKNFADPLVGGSLRRVEINDYSWSFFLSDETFIVTESDWRLMGPAGIIVASQDHGNQFGRPAPVDAKERVLGATVSQTVRSASISSAGDLLLDFDRVRLQFLRMSCGSESWRLTIRGVEIIGTGGGEIVKVHSPVHGA